MPRSASVGGLAKRGVIPRKQFYIKLFVFNTVILVQCYIDHYNNGRPNSATGYTRPKDMLAGRQQEIHAERDRKLEEATKMREDRRQQAA